MHRQAKVFLFSGPGANPKSVADVEQILSDDSQQRFNVVTMDHMPTNFLTSSFDAVVFPGGSGAQQYSSLGAEGQAMVRTFVKDNKGGYLGICAGAYLACGGGGFGLDLVDGCTPWRHSLWPRGGRLYGTIEVTDEIDESHPSYECNFSNGALFETQELPPSAVPIGIVRQGTGSAIQKAGLEGKAVVVAARASSCSGPEKCGKVVLCGCHVERDTCALKHVNGVLQQFVELVVENSKQRPKDRSPVALCECTKCIPLSDAARKEIAAAELARKRRIRAYVQAAEEEWLEKLFEGELPGLSGADFSPQLLAQERAHWLSVADRADAEIAAAKERGSTRQELPSVGEQAHNHTK